MPSTLSTSEEAQLSQTIEMFEVITQSQPLDYQSLEILKEAYSKLGRDAEVIGTSKRIAQAYVQLGQLSSAILEYETILQRFPDDPDVQAALRQIESKANNISAQPTVTESPVKPVNGKTNGAHHSGNGKIITSSAEIDDGRQTMQKIFVDSKLVSAVDFELCWKTQNLSEPVTTVVEPFIQTLADKGFITSERSLKALVDKSRLAYLPLDRYEIDIEMARTFPPELCRRWCILPFDRLSKSIMVATVNPFNRQAAKEISEATKSRVLWYLTAPTEIVSTLRKIFR